MTEVSADRLGGYLARVLPELGAVEDCRKFGKGQSNPTYLLTAAGGQAVLRAQPPGPLLPSAHQVAREFRVMQALSGSDVPVPQMLHLAQGDDSPLGRDFFVMEYVEGEIFWDPAVPEVSAETRGALYDEMNCVLAALHSIDPAAIGLGEFGRPGDYFARQLKRWSAQYRASERNPKLDMDRLMNWLAEALPKDDGQAVLVHGDFRLDNMIFTSDGRKVLSLLDWELSTLGHPMADLAYQCMQWRMPHDSALKGLDGLDRAALGLPSEADYIARYAARRGVSIPVDWVFYLAFAYFRLAAILEGVGARCDAGNASNPEMAQQYGSMVPMLAADALAIIKEAEVPV